MARIPFRVARVYYGSWVAAGRFALSGLYNHSQRAGERLATVRAEQISNLWAERAPALLRDLVTPRRVAAAVCCPAFGVGLWPRRKPCHSTQFCPFCWSRNYSYDMCRRIEATIRQYEEGELGLWLLRQGRPVLNHDEAPAAVAGMGRSRLNRVRRLLPGAIGGARLDVITHRVPSSVENVFRPGTPLHDLWDDHWYVESRMLLLAPADSELREDLLYSTETYECSRIPIDKRWKVVRAVGKATYYPPEYLRCSASATRAILWMLQQQPQRSRLYSCFGEVRGAVPPPPERPTRVDVWNYEELQDAADVGRWDEEIDSVHSSVCGDRVVDAIERRGRTGVLTPVPDRWD